MNVDMSSAQPTILVIIFRRDLPCREVYTESIQWEDFGGSTADTKRIKNHQNRLRLEAITTHVLSIYADDRFFLFWTEAGG